MPGSQNSHKESTIAGIPAREVRLVFNVTI